jgi:hypothetical protein
MYNSILDTIMTLVVKIVIALLIQLVKVNHQIHLYSVESMYC